MAFKVMIADCFVCVGSQAEHHGNGDCKRQETEAPSSQPSTTSHLDLNFPLPGEKGPSCLVKVILRPHLFIGLTLREPSLKLKSDAVLQVYKDWDSFKVNDMVEVYGVLSVSPALSVLNDEK